jgi:hypothetical protein
LNDGNWPESGPFRVRDNPASVDKLLAGLPPMADHCPG